MAAGLLSTVGTSTNGASAAPTVPIQNTNNPFANTNLSQPLGSGNALPGQNYFSPSTQGLISQQESQANPGFFESTLNRGIGGNQGIAAPNTVNSSDPMAEALANRYGAQTQQAQQALTTQNDVNAPVQASAEQSTVENELGAEYQNQVNNFNQQYQFEIQRQQLLNQWQTAQNQAQAGIFGAIFSGIGALGGGALGGLVGGPAGAVAGAAAGSKL